MTHNELDHAVSVEAGALFDYAPLIDWKPEYNLGIPILDIQHRGLIDAINSLHFAMTNELGDDILEPMVNMAREYARIHFRMERLLIKKYGPSCMERYIEVSDRLKESMFDVGQESIFNQDPEVFLRFLKEWVDGIIRDKDWFRNCFFGKGSACPKKDKNSEG